MRIAAALLTALFLSAGCADAPTAPDHRGGNGIQSPTPAMQSDCGNELPENCEEEETHNEL